MIVRDPNIHGGVPIIQGTRIDVNTVMSCINDCITIEEICKDYKITIDDIDDCITYCIENGGNLK